MRRGKKANESLLLQHENWEWEANKKKKNEKFCMYSNKNFKMRSELYNKLVDDRKV